ncbi:hypothetical protein F5144DRAFT_542108 [Chaetomium tenue]|uniref:Uncharacterized protein n=1 Tax=Chaetomium tenue TaxID=1854479 RepID=A0ACB7NVL4_9PEZI|nr:hypothetical protein F5144DRAFT_542108 [Chaetomium globosum]
MTTPSGSAPLPHRSVANIRSPTGVGHQSGPSTPLRSISAIPSNFGSPSSLRADEEIIIIEFGTRKLQVGFSGDSVPRGCVWFAPDQQRRAGDFRAWQTDYRHEWRAEAADGSWGKSHELWQYDVRDADLGLVGDKIERALREAFTKYLLIDSRPRRLVWVIPSTLPIPLLSAALDSVFSRFMSPTISLLSSQLALTVGAGVRSALVVDLGWNETTVTSVCEYREVDSRRSIRGGRMLVEQTHNLLAKNLTETGAGDGEERVISFEECSDITTRMVWCKPRQASVPAQPPSDQPSSDALATVQEQDEGDLAEHITPRASGSVTIPLKTWKSPTTLELPFDALAEPCENAFFDSQYSYCCFDDHEQPLHLLVYRSLLQLPLDVRALCMSRIIFTGGCANVLGLRGRIFDEVSHLVQERGWDPVQGKAVEKLRTNPKLKRRGAGQEGNASPGNSPQAHGGEEKDGVWHDAVNTTPEVDAIEEQLKRGTDRRPRVQGEMRAIESLGAWSGASLITQLKAPAIATIDRELWLQHGAAGASRASEVDHKTQRQSLGPGGLIRGSAAGSAWTLGVWGTN